MASKLAIVSKALMDTITAWPDEVVASSNCASVRYCWPTPKRSANLGDALLWSVMFYASKEKKE
jgi:hypothetical protein